MLQQSNCIDDLKAQIELDKEAIDAIETCSKHQKVITDDVLHLSKLEANKLTLNIVTFKLKKAIETAVHMFDAELKRKNMGLDLMLPLSEIAVRGDPDRYVSFLKEDILMH